jgi:membrane protease YdiL (CAAX protease family)
LLIFLLVSVAWSAVFNPGKEKLLEQLGTNEGAALLLLSAALTCVVAPICEELLFRGFVFTALRNWRGTWPAAAITGVVFGGVHAFSAPALDLPPLAGLGFGLCLLYRYTGSLYPCIVAHSLNNSVAFASLENWGLGEALVLIVSALATIGVLVLACKRIGVIGPEPRRRLEVPSAQAHRIGG